MPDRPPVYRPPGCRPPAPARPPAHRRGYTRAWSRRAKAFLRDNPLCAHCRASGLLVPATAVDHVVPHCGDPGLFHSGDLQALCPSCHARKTARGE